LITVFSVFLSALSELLSGPSRAHETVASSLLIQFFCLKSPLFWQILISSIEEKLLWHHCLLSNTVCARQDQTPVQSLEQGQKDCFSLVFPSTNQSGARLYLFSRPLSLSLLSLFISLSLSLYLLSLFISLSLSRSLSLLFSPCNSTL
jgi:hypothetical protein